MKVISFWARDHRIAARLLIVLIKFSLAALAFITGKNLLAAGLQLPPGFSVAIVFLFFIVCLLYPSRQNSRLNKKTLYIRQKTCDFLLPLCTFLMIVCCANQNNPLNFFTGNPIYASNLVKEDPPAAAEIIKSLQNGRDKNTLTRQEKRILKKEFNVQLKTLVIAKLSGDKEATNRTLLTILTIIGAVGLLFLLASLSCSLSCNGADGAAIAVLVVGLTGLIWGSIVIIKRINRPKKTVSTASP